ncbi:MAG: RluA family pseudouridine synthase [Cyclobacteriaceae bacterium]|nr:RluA family pseudouridine synthase [Cyclobacteriaceae bacterium]
MGKRTWNILYEDNHLLIINKPAGMLVQGDATGDEPLVESAKRYVKEKYQKPGEVFMGVVHRLDRPVSGVVVFARTSKALERMNALFRDRDTEKVYWAIVGKKPQKSEDTLVHWLRKDEKKNKTTSFIRETENALRSELSYKVIGHAHDAFLLEIKPITGRPHQIRVQLASIGCPIVGDVKYGYPQPNEDENICLHARSLSFVHPVKKELVKITAPLPDTGLWSNFADFEE